MSALRKRDLQYPLQVLGRNVGSDREYGWGDYVEEIDSSPRMCAERLPFERKDVLRTVIKRGSIRSRNEYDTIADGLVIWRQEGRITEGDFAVLSKLIGKYEERGE